jgi:hypothetical protein
MNSKNVHLTAPQVRQRYGHRSDMWLWRRNYPRPFCRDRLQALTVFRMVLKAVGPGLSRAVSTTVRMAASPSAAHIAR